MKLAPVELKLHQFGNSAGLIVPAALARAIGFEPGSTWLIRLREDQRGFRVTARQLQKRVGLLVPAAIRGELGVEVGDTLTVPIGTWKPIDQD